MAYKFKDMAMESSTSTGTGAFTLDGAETGYVDLPIAEFPDLLYYCIMQDDGSQWEVGYGYITEGGPRSLTRTSVLLNSSGGTTKVNFTAGTKHVYNVFPASLANFAKTMIDGFDGTSFSGQMVGSTADATPQDITTSFAPTPKKAGGISYWHIEFQVCAVGTSSGAVKSWTGYVTVVSGSLGSPSKTVVDNAGSKSWDFTMVLTVDDEITFTVTGEAGEGVSWTVKATIDLAVEVGI